MMGADHGWIMPVLLACLILEGNTGLR
eukprot:COSAG01_NODE_17677_length_1132_cov_1.158761_1_plen_26_part_10